MKTNVIDCDIRFILGLFMLVVSTVMMRSRSDRKENPRKQSWIRTHEIVRKIHQNFAERKKKSIEKISNEYFKLSQRLLGRNMVEVVEE